MRTAPTARSQPRVRRLQDVGVRARLTALSFLSAKWCRSPSQQFIKLRLGWPNNLVLQHLYQPVGRGVDDHIKYPVVFVLKVYEHCKGGLPFLQDGGERDHVVRHSRLQLKR